MVGDALQTPFRKTVLLVDSAIVVGCHHLRDMFMHTLSGYNKIQIIILNKRAMDVSLNGPFAAMLKVHSSSKKKTALKKQKWFIF